ncbi:hypothetical protein U1769_02385 [Sphingomonas sp. ZT3P38]|uniref:hypothetical protein n=1 Tax=Parasphingomonas zepuensis TaxID=3096161 RepID=UPI002FCB5CED
MYKPMLGFAALAVALGAASATPAEARSRGHVLSIQGAHGRGLVQTRSVNRQRGAASVNRSLQTNGGRGYQASRSRDYGPGHYASDRSVHTNDGRGYDTARTASWGNGSYSGGRTTTTGDGRTTGRSTSAIDNGDGTASYNSTVTRLNGNTRTVSGTIPRP